uniref:Secreted protein n=1 Tax=Chlamydomonas euryale TaxID=1486919 RepID=A0A6U2HI08_9CHLO
MLAAAVAVAVAVPLNLSQSDSQVCAPRLSSGPLGLRVDCVAVGCKHAVLLDWMCWSIYQAAFCSPAKWQPLAATQSPAAVGSPAARPRRHWSA